MELERLSKFIIKGILLLLFINILIVKKDNIILINIVINNIRSQLPLVIKFIKSITYKEIEIHNAGINNSNIIIF